ncbi:MAG TPA: tetratricopeptide repeat protein [Pyrinomonadaceae bacterium]|nr:tetratricopeptide repeat protein [Pyrinomonadaceae bacterium]
MSPEPHNSIEVFYSYAHEDEKLRDELKKHLSNLKRQGVITDWYDRDISAGKEWDDEIKQHLESARVVLLLISPDFMDSDYINDVEVKRAIERHESGEARVIPVILRPVDWQGAPFSKLQGLPTEMKPVTSWDDSDEAFLDITKGIRKAIQELSGPSANVPTVPDIPRPPRVGFVSRRDKGGHDIVQRLRVELAPDKNQLVALWGAGGVGKTTLAAEAVRALAEAYGQRIIWVTADARPNFAFSTLLDDIAAQLGRTDLRPLTISQKEEALHPLIGTKPTLIVLDNLETIAPEEKSLCKEFLAKRVHCPALITTRERVDNAYLIPLAAMTSHEANEFLGRLIAQTHDPDIYQDVDHTRILQTAEFNPLIIQWIVAQIDLAQDPEEVLTDLAHGEGDAAQRVYDRSFNLRQMADGGRAVLLALSLFVPNATRAAAAEVSGMGGPKHRKRFKKAQQTLASLWLVKQADGGQRLAVEGLTRELSKNRLTSDPRFKLFLNRYLDRFVRYAKSNSSTNRVHLDMIEEERDNILNTLDFLIELHDWRRFMIVYSAIVRFLDLRGYWDDSIKRGEQAINVSYNLGDRDEIAYVAHCLAIAYQQRGSLTQARKLYDESLEIRKASGDQRNVARILYQLADLTQEEGDLDQAKQLFQESLDILIELGDESGAATSKNALGAVLLRQGDTSGGKQLCGESVATFKKIANEHKTAHALQNLGTIARDEGNHVEARKLYNESLEIARKLGDKKSMATTLTSLGIIAEREGNKLDFENFYLEAMSILEKLSSPQLGAVRASFEKKKRDSSFLTKQNRSKN